MRTFYDINKSYLLARISSEQMKEAVHRKAGRLLEAKKCARMIEQLLREVNALDEKYGSIEVREVVDGWKGAKY